MNQSPVKNSLKFKLASSVLPLESLINPDDKICLLKKRINWTCLHDELGYLFENKQAPSMKLILGLLYLQSIDNLPYSDVIAIWEKSPEWQYFCGEEFLSDTLPMLDAHLSIWSRVIGEDGRTAMMRALGDLRYNVTLH